jgi:hypothetical protein
MCVCGGGVTLQFVQGVGAGGGGGRYVKDGRKGTSCSMRESLASEGRIALVMMNAVCPLVRSSACRVWELFGEGGGG